MFAETPIDSLKIYHRLKAANLEENAATEIASIFSDVIENNLTTKQDLKNSEIILRKDSKELETNLKHDMKEMESGLKHDIKEMGSSLELKIEQSKNETLKWMIGWTSGLFLAQTGILISAIKFFK